MSLWLPGVVDCENAGSHGKGVERCVFLWAFPEADPETKISVKVVDLGAAPRKGQAGEHGRSGRQPRKVTSPLITAGNWCPVLLAVLGASVEQAFEATPPLGV